MRCIVILFLLLPFGLSAQKLEDYQQLAAAQNPLLQARYKDFEAALQRTSQVNSLPDPTLSLGYFIAPVETRVGPQRAKISLSQMFPWFGTLRTRGDAAALLAEAKYEAFLEAQNLLYYQVAQAYYPVYELRQWTLLEDENKEILKSYKRLSLQQFEQGRGSMVDVLRVDLMLNESEANLQILTLRQKPLLAAFNALLNRNEAEDFSVSDSLDIGVAPMPDQTDSLFAAHPAIKGFDLKLRASEKMEQAAIKQGLPNIGVGLDYVMVDKRADMDVTDNGKDIFMPMVSISLPIFRGKYKAAVHEARLSRESLALQKENYTNQLVSSYSASTFELEKQRQLAALYDQQIAESNQGLRLLYTAYGQGGEGFEEVLRMQQQLLKYKKMKATAIMKYHLAMAQQDYITAKKTLR